MLSPSVYVFKVGALLGLCFADRLTFVVLRSSIFQKLVWLFLHFFQLEVEISELHTDTDRQTLELDFEKVNQFGGSVCYSASGSKKNACRLKKKIRNFELKHPF